MKLKTITYSRTVQVKQYEPERLEITVEVEEGESSREVFETLKYQVENLLGVQEDVDGH